eukprot:4026721-Alexandrium_andersonii.AAC.1
MARHAMNVYTTCQFTWQGMSESLCCVPPRPLRLQEPPSQCQNVRSCTMRACALALNTAPTPSTTSPKQQTCTASNNQ